MSLIDGFAPYIAAVIFVALLQYAAKRNSKIGKIVDKAEDILLNKIIFSLAVLEFNLTLWLGIIMVILGAIFFIALQINPDVWGLINGEFAFTCTLVVSVILALGKPLVRPNTQVISN